MNNISIIEVRGATGGDEAKIWAQDLLRMYLRFAQRMGWKTVLLDEGIARIDGQNAYETFKTRRVLCRVQRFIKELKNTTSSATALFHASPEKL